MNIIINTLCIGLIIELWLLWLAYFYPNRFYKLWGDVDFYSRVFCSFVCWVFFNSSSVITQTTNDGEIVKQIFIGYY